MGTTWQMERIMRKDITKNKRSLVLRGGATASGAKPNDKWKTDQMQLNVTGTTKTLERGIK